MEIAGGIGGVRRLQLAAALDVETDGRERPIVHAAIHGEFERQPLAREVAGEGGERAERLARFIAPEDAKIRLPQVEAADGVGGAVERLVAARLRLDLGGR